MTDLIKRNIMFDSEIYRWVEDKAFQNKRENIDTLNIILKWFG